MRDLLISRLGAVRPGQRSDFDLIEESAARQARRQSPELRRAAVLVPIIDRPRPSVLLTRRAAHLKDHAGQVSFPGGRVEDGDRDATATALRETGEEIGLAPRQVEIIGAIDRYETVTGFDITPVVGLIEPGFTLDPDPREVAEVFEVPLAVIFDPANHRRHSRQWRGSTRRFYVIPYKDYYIWGATAGMLVNLSEKVKGL